MFFSKKLVFLSLIVIIQSVMAACPKSDLTGDCKVNLDDLAVMVSEWLNEGIPDDSLYQGVYMADIQGSDFNVKSYAKINREGNSATSVFPWDTACVGIYSGSTLNLSSESINYSLIFLNNGNFSGTWNGYGMSGQITGEKVISNEWPYGDTYDVGNLGIPRFVDEDYIELEKISRISKFRSGVGHDYSDDFESCRNMKHYFDMKAGIDWTNTKLFSPVNGKITGITQEWAGAQVWIQSFDNPSFEIRVFHVNLLAGIDIGISVSKGQQIGLHASETTNSDIAVHVMTPDGIKYVSYFDVMNDTLFQKYQNRGLSTREDVIISQEDRDADPLECSGESFIYQGQENPWFDLQEDMGGTVLIDSDFDSDIPGNSPLTGGENQPYNLTIPVDGSILVKSESNGITSQPVELYDGGNYSYISLDYRFSSVTSGILRVETTVSLNRYSSGYFLQTSVPTAVATRLEFRDNGKIMNVKYPTSVNPSVNLGSYVPNRPFRIRMDIDLDTKKWSATIDDEMDGFDNDPTCVDLLFQNDVEDITGIGRVHASLSVYSYIIGETRIAYDDFLVIKLAEANH